MVKLLYSNYKLIEDFKYYLYIKKNILKRRKTKMEEKITEVDTFYTDIRDVGAGVLGVSIPKRLHEAAGYKIGDSVKVMIKKHEKE